MDLYAACDICGHRYVLPDDRHGRRTKCKSCGVPFEVLEVNFYDPETSEVDEDELSDDEPQPGLVTRVFRGIGHAITGVVTIGLLVWMTSLFFRSPQNAVAALNTSPTADSQTSQPGFGSQQTRPFVPRTNRQRPGLSQTPFVPPAMPPGPTFPPQGTPTSPQPGPPTSGQPFNPSDIHRQIQQQMQQQQQQMQEQMQRAQRQFAPPPLPPNQRQ